MPRVHHQRLLKNVRLPMAVLVCMSGASRGATIIASHTDPGRQTAFYGIGCYFMGQSFTVEGTAPVRISSFKWIGVERMPPTDTLFVFDRPFTGDVSQMNSSVAGFMATAELVSGTSTYTFGTSVLLDAGSKYFAYMSTSLLEAPAAPLPYNTVGYYGPAASSFPTTFNGWTPQAPLNWFDSYSGGEAYFVGSYLRDGPFLSLGASLSKPPRWECDYLFEVSGEVVPELSVSLLMLSGAGLWVFRRNDRTSRAS